MQRARTARLAVLLVFVVGCEPIVDDVFRGPSALDSNAEPTPPTATDPEAPRPPTSNDGSDARAPDTDPPDAGEPTSVEPSVEPVVEPGAEPVVEPTPPTPTVELAASRITVEEGAGVVTVQLELVEPPPVEVTAEVAPSGVEAQAGCFVPDFVAERAAIRWPAGERTAGFEIEIVDDETAEIDEGIALELEAVQGAEWVGANEVRVVILDDDRNELVDAATRFGLEPDSPDDQSERLQDALDAAASAGRGVVLLAAGTYVVTTAVLSPGTSLVGHGATLVRPPNAGSAVVTLRSEHSGAEDSAVTLLQGFVIDGQRDEQGPFEALEQQDAHLTYLAGDPLAPGRLRAEVQGVTVVSGTGDGLAIGPNTDASACQVAADDVFREGLSVHGGNTRLRLREFTASASLGTCGMWLDGDIVGFPDNRVVDIAMEDVRLETGDLEISVADGSQVHLDNLLMGAAPFRLSAPNSTVRITDSVLWLGIPSDRHNHWAAPDDTVVRGSTLVLSESLDEESVLEEMDRQWAGVRVIWPDPELTTGRILFDACQFEVAGDVEPGDVVQVAESLAPGGELLIRGSSTGDCACEWFGPTCTGCVLEP